MTRIVHERRASGILYNLLRSSDRPGRVVLPANVCPIVPLTCLKAGREIELVDIAPEGLALDTEETLRRIRLDPDGYGAVVYVHPYGAESRVEGFFTALGGVSSDLLVIDDRCLAPPDTDPVLTRGADAVLYSTGYAKPVDLGSGGFAGLAEATEYRRWSSPFSPEDLERAESGYKEAIAARRALDPAVWRADWLDLAPPGRSWADLRGAIERGRGAIDERRRRLNRIYGDRIPETTRLGEPFNGWRFQILVPEPDRLVADLFDHGLFASRHYASLGEVVAPGAFPAADRLHERIVNLFNDFRYDETKAEATAERVVRHLELVSS